MTERKRVLEVESRQGRVGLLALQGRGVVRFGNAPLQSCDWSKVICETKARTVQAFYSSFFGGDIRVELVDLRQHIVRRRALGTVETSYHGEDAEFCVPIDLGSDSLLQALYSDDTGPTTHMKSRMNRMSQALGRARSWSSTRSAGTVCWKTSATSTSPTPRKS